MIKISSINKKTVKTAIKVVLYGLCLYVLVLGGFAFYVWNQNMREMTHAVKLAQERFPMVEFEDKSRSIKEYFFTKAGYENASCINVGYENVDVNCCCLWQIHGIVRGGLGLIFTAINGYVLRPFGWGY